jgi:hypothetical protein
MGHGDFDLIAKGDRLNHLNMVDPEYLRKHYATLSDEALLDLNPAELVPAARAVLEAELAKRQLDAPEEFEEGEEPLDFDGPPAVDGEEPEWLEEAAEVYSAAVRPGTTTASQAHHARAALEAAGIPVYLDVYEEEPEEQPQTPEPTSRYRVLVPGNLNLPASNVLQRDMFNDGFESGWRTYLEVLSNDEIREVDPKEIFCGIYDQIERIQRAFHEELVRRRLK